MGQASPQHDPSHELAELATVAGGLAHEIRNPLSTMKVNLQLLEEDWADTSLDEGELRRRSRNRLAVVRGEAERLDGILADFLRLATRHELNLTESDLNVVVREMVEFLAPDDDGGALRMRIALHDVPLPCRMDVNLIKQVLLNVLKNAREAMPEGGELLVRTRPDGPDGVRVDVTDTGVGMSADEVARAFRAYHSTKKGGTGLGLTMTRRIVREHGGTVVLESEPGTGTNVVIRLPREGKASGHGD